jgi:NAD(P)-dependent dehydrogenase (short-subunit alcohol dehydrogenase family)/pimeloyl-ACP methyl ester carboxylesterase
MATFVLVPGAWLGGWCWRDVAHLLRSAGHDAIAITLTGLAERAHLLTPPVGLDTHIDDVTGALLYENLHDVILVGHSYGGVVVTAAAARVRERLRSLVYLDASIPEHGRSNNDVLPPHIGEMIRESARLDGDGWRVPPPAAIDWGLDDDTRAWVVPRLTPHPLKSLEDPAHLLGEKLAAVPRVFLRTSPSSGAYQPFFERARAEGWLCHELDGGHYAMLTAPDVVATALLSLAREGRLGGPRQTQQPMADQASSRSIRFEGQVAVVTGAGRGLGAAYARLLAARGASVVVHDAGVAADGSGFDPAVADAVVHEIIGRGGTAVACYENLESAEGCRRVVQTAVERFNRIDVLVHNAGLVIFRSVEATDQVTWDRMVNLGVHAPFHLVQAALPHMKRQGYGRIVLTTSGRAMRLDSAAPGLAAYCVGKMGQLGLMVGVAAEMQDIDIQVNAISPVAATRMLRRHAPELRPEHVAPGVAFLASSLCNVSGVVLRAAGGRFSTGEYHFSDDVDLGSEPGEPEMLAEHWREISAGSSATAGDPPSVDMNTRSRSRQ